MSGRLQFAINKTKRKTLKLSLFHSIQEPTDIGTNPQQGNEFILTI
jgi:hypothetical protein